MKNLKELFSKNNELKTDKWNIYLDKYEEILQNFRKSEIKLLEIGIQNGGSLEIWNEYFPKAKKIIGCDIDLKCASLKYNDSKIKVVIGDINKTDTIAEIDNVCSDFDIIIDDGSHKSGDIIKSFIYYFKRLNVNGVYIVEDLHCSYWHNYNGGLYFPYSSISFFKKLIDLINYDHWGLESSRNEILINFCKYYSLDKEIDALEMIHSIEFVNSMCIIRKKSAELNKLGKRLVTGNTDLVKKEKFLLEKSIVDERTNYWSKSEHSPELQPDHLSEKDKIIAELSLTLKDIYSSRSWKILEPLRKLKKFKNRLISILLFIYNFIKVNRLKTTFKKLFFLIINGEFKSVGRKYWRSSLNFEKRKEYQLWFDSYYQINSTLINNYSLQIQEFNFKPKISIIMPVYNPPISFLEKAISSVINQIYVNWELCIADDKSNDSETLAKLRNFEELDKRIKIRYRSCNGHISAASNTALELAEGDFIALLDQDDELTADALFWVAKYINEDPDVSLLYSDEDKIDHNGEIFDPYFKSDWNRDLFYSHNMISHLGIYRRSIVSSIGGFREGFEGSQDYDLALRVIEQIDNSHIKHIPRILYHWRYHPDSTSYDSNAKPYAMKAGENAINDHFKRLNINGKVVLDKWGYVPTYYLPLKKPSLEIIIPTKDNPKFLKKCVSSLIQKSTYENFTITIIDNGCTLPESKELLDYLSANASVTTLPLDVEFNYSYLNNFAVNRSNAEIICLLNDDTELITPGWIEFMIGIAIQKGIGAVGARLWYPDSTLQHGGIILGLGGIAGHSHQGLIQGDPGYFSRADLTQSFSAVTGACMMFKKTSFNLVGGLDEKLAVSYNDVDFCLKLSSHNLRTVFCPQANFFHFESKTRGYDETPEKKSRLAKESEYLKGKWPQLTKLDPFYNLNLSLEKTDYSLSFPPRII